MDSCCFTQTSNTAKLKQIGSIPLRQLTEQTLREIALNFNSNREINEMNTLEAQVPTSGLTHSKMQLLDSSTIHSCIL